MPRGHKLTPEQVALIHVYAKLDWTHERIAKHLGGVVTRSAVSYALARRVNPFPSAVQTIVADIMEKCAHAAQRAMARELRTMADELDRGYKLNRPQNGLHKHP